MSEHPDLDARARDVIDANTYMVLGTLDPDGEPRLSPVYFTHVDYADFYWVSSPGAHHSRNVQRHPSISVVIFDSSVPVGAGQCVYVRADDAAVVPDTELDAHCRAAFAGDLRRAVSFAPDELSGDAPLRLYRAEATSYDVHVRGRDPVHGTGIDRRIPADPRDVGA
jgi:Pyridoxamine 5'-phosphate oxidase